MLRLFGLTNKYRVVRNRDKIKWVYLKQNPLGLDVVAYRGHEDPPEIIDFIKQYINYDKIFNTALKKKLDMFYGALNWDEIVDKEKSMEKFF